MSSENPYRSPAPEPESNESESNKSELNEQDSSNEDSGQQDNQSRLAFSSAGILFFNLAGQPFALISALLVANYLGPDEKGLAAATRVLPSFMAGTSGLGVAAALKYKLSRKDHTFDQIGLSSLFITLLQGLIAGGIFVWLASTGWLGELALNFPLWVKVCCAALIPVLMLRQTLFMGFAGNMNFKIENILNFLTGIIFGGLSIFLVVFKKMGFEGVLISFLSATCFASIGALILFFRIHKPNFKINFGFIRFSYHYGLRAWIGTLAKRSNAELDQLFLGILAPAGALGNYSVAATLGRLLYLVPNAIAPVFMNQVAEAKGNIAGKKIATIHRSMLMMVICSGVAIAAGVAIIAPFVLPEYVDVPLILLLLIPGAVFYSTFRMLGSYFIGIGQPEKSSYCQFIALIGSIISYPLLVPAFGGYGAAMASSVTYFVMYLLVVSMFVKKVSLPKLELFSFRKSDLQWLKTQLLGVWNRINKFNKKKA